MATKRRQETQKGGFDQPGRCGDLTAKNSKSAEKRPGEKGALKQPEDCDWRGAFRRQRNTRARKNELSRFEIRSYGFPSNAGATSPKFIIPFALVSRIEG